MKLSHIVGKRSALFPFARKEVDHARNGADERLAQIVVDFDGNYSTHMRDEGYYVLEAVNEFLNVIRKTGLRGTVSHLNIKYDNGVPNEYLFKGMQMLKDAGAFGSLPDTSQVSLF